MANQVESLYEAFAENRGGPFQTVIRPCLSALDMDVWGNVTDHTREEFFRLGPFTDKREEGIPHQGGFYVQPGWMQLAIRKFCETRSKSSIGLPSAWFNSTDTFRLPATPTIAAQCAKGFRFALPVSR